MKELMIVMGVVLIAGYAQAQTLNESDVPAVVKQTFAQKFPKAKEVKWETEDATAIEVEFVIGKEEQSAKFDLSGKWMETETTIKKSQLPQAVRATIEKEFSGFAIEEAEKAETANQAILYEVELKSKDVSYDVQFSSIGEIIKKEAKKKEEEKDDKD